MNMEAFENLTANSTFDPDTTYFLSSHLEIPIALATLLSIISNVLIVSVVIKYPIMHTRLYYYLASWSICNLLSTSSVPASLNILGFAEIISITVFCLWCEINFVFMLGNLIFVAVVTVDWYVLTFTGQSYCAARCRRYHKLFIAAVWILLGLLLVLSCLLCLDRLSFPLSILLFLFGYVTVFVLIVIFLVLRIVMLKASSVVFEKRNLELKLVFSYFLCWLPNIISLICALTNPPGHFPAFLEYLTYLIGYSNACVTLILLCIYDKNFKACLYSLLNIDINHDDGIKEAQNAFLIDS